MAFLKYNDSPVILNNVFVKHYDEDLVTYMVGLTTPLSAYQKDLLDNFVTTVKSGFSISRLYDAFDIMNIYAGETSESSLRNLVKRANDSTTVSSPTFTAFEGFTGNGSTSYVTTNYTPSLHAVKYAQDDANWSTYIRNNKTSAYIGIYNDPYCTLLPWLYSAPYHTYWSINDNTVSNRGFVGTSLGLWMLNRTNSANRQLYRNTVQEHSYSTASTGIPDTAMSLGGPWYKTYHQFAFNSAGRSLSTAERTVLKNAIEEYMDARGKGVIA